MWGNTAINTIPTFTNYMQADPVRAIKQIKDVMSVFKYHDHPTINSNLVAVKLRIQDRLDELDNQIMPNWVRSPGWAKWTPMDLAGKWHTYATTVAQRARDKGWKYITDNLRKIREAYISKINRAMAASAQPGTPSADLAILLDKIDALTREWDAYEPNSWDGRPF